jgi:ubiquinone/menaquinone biosynthesis C-methylase UbiE
VTSASELWSGASYERIAATFAPIHDRIVRELAPRPGEAFLDLACGNGGIALLAARSGAAVTGLDISADQLAKARAAADQEGLALTLDDGDCQALPYVDASFDAVASGFGLIFAASHAKAAAEVARVARPGGRLAFTAWRRDGWADLARNLGRPMPPGDDEYLWAREEHAHSLLGEAFELRFESGEWLVTDTPEGLWDLISSSAPPLRRWIAGLPPDEQADVRAAYLRYLGEGELRRPFVLVLGTRR